MITDLLFYSCMYLVLYGIMILLHEIGHYFAYWMIVGKPPKISFKNRSVLIGKEIDWFILHNEQKTFILGAGVIFGFIPVLFINVVTWLDWLVSVMCVFSVIWGSMHDIVEMIRLSK